MLRQARGARVLLASARRLIKMRRGWRMAHRFVCIAAKIISRVKDFLCKLSLMVKDAALAMMPMRMCSAYIKASAYRRRKHVWLRSGGKLA